MRRCVTVLVLSVALCASVVGVAISGELDFRDDFERFDSERWSAGDHKLGRSYLDPDNVSAANSNLRIKLPARTLDGGEVYTNGLYGHRSYTARMKVPRAPGSITGFFMYKSPDYASELDIEIFNDTSRKILFTTYAGGKQTNTETMKLPFDPTAGYHEYRFDYHEDYVAFYVNGQLMRKWDSGHPDTAMHLMINAWHPTWLQAKKPPRDKYLLVDYVDHRQDPEPDSATEDLTATAGDQLRASEPAPPAKGGKKKR